MLVVSCRIEITMIGYFPKHFRMAIRKLRKTQHVIWFVFFGTWNRYENIRRTLCLFFYSAYIKKSADQINYCIPLVFQYFVLWILILWKQLLSPEANNIKPIILHTRSLFWRNQTISLNILKFERATILLNFAFRLSAWSFTLIGQNFSKTGNFKGIWRNII